MVRRLLRRHQAVDLFGPRRCAIPRAANCSVWWTFQRCATASIVIGWRGSASAPRIEERLSCLRVAAAPLEWGIGTCPGPADGGLLFYDRRGRLTAIVARPRFAGAGAESSLNTHAAIQHFASIRLRRPPQARIPHWLCPEWIEAGRRARERLGRRRRLWPRPAMVPPVAPARGDFAIAAP